MSVAKYLAPLDEDKWIGQIFIHPPSEFIQTQQLLLTP